MWSIWISKLCHYSSSVYIQAVLLLYILSNWITIFVWSNSPAVSRGNKLTTQTVLAVAWWPPSEIIWTRVHVPHLLAAAAIQGQHLFRSRGSDCVATIQGRPLFEGCIYSKKTIFFDQEFNRKMYSCLPIDHIHTWKALLVSSVSRESLSSIWKPCCWANSAAPLSTNMLNEACSSTHRATDIGLAYLKSEHIYKRDKNTSKTCAPKEARKPKQHYQKQAKAQGSNRTSF